MAETTRFCKFATIEFIYILHKSTKIRAMEKIILFLIIFGIGSLFEYLKKMKEKKAGLEGMADAPLPHSRKMPGRMTPIDAMTHSAAVPAPESTARTVSAQRPQQARNTTFLPGERLRNISHDNDIAATEPQESPAIGAITASDAPDPEREAHFQHWRQAIIDAEILQRKF